MDATAKLLAALWQRNRPQVMERVALLERAADGPFPLPADQLQAAISTAHKLAGSLGMYGFSAGTDAARALEQAFEQPSTNAAHLQELCRQLHVALEE